MWASEPANFQKFLQKFVKLTDDEWDSWERVFVKRPESPWVQRPVSVDMLKQFLTRQVTEAAIANLVVQIRRPEHCSLSASTLSVCEDDIFWKIIPNKISEFFEIMCDYKAATSFLSQYVSEPFVRGGAEHVLAYS